MLSPRQVSTESSILIIEDNPANQKLLSVNLSARGYAVASIDSALTGLQMLRNQQPSLLILDIWLPDMSGLEVLEILSKDTALSQLPVVVITASPGSAASIGEEYSQVKEVIVKPILLEKLLTAVAHSTGSIYKC